MEIISIGTQEVINKNELRRELKRVVETGILLMVKLRLDPTTILWF